MDQGTEPIQSIKKLSFRTLGLGFRKIVEASIQAQFDATFFNWLGAFWANLARNWRIGSILDEFEY